MTADRRIVSVPVADDLDAELVSDRLFSLGASAVSELRGGPAGEDRTLVADLPADSLPALDRPFGVLDQDPSWTSSWQEHARVVRVGRNLVVRPSWLTGGTVPEGLGPDDVEIVVAAADAFGSGSHPTTRLCLAAVERLVRPGDRVLDVGSGSGVLGVAALLLGAGSLTAIDVDPAALAATSETARLNDVGARVEVSDRPPSDDVSGTFDLVLANLLIPIIEDLGPSLGRTVAPGGHLVLSGVLDDQVDRAVAAIDLPPVGMDSDAGWAAVTVRARP